MNAPTRESVELAQRELERELRNPASIMILTALTAAYLADLDAPEDFEEAHRLAAPDPLS